MNAKVLALTLFCLKLFGQASVQALPQSMTGDSGLHLAMARPNIAAHQLASNPRLIAHAVAANSGIAMSVRDFGAAGDGTTDDTAAFSSALTAAAGKQLVVPAGTYRITRTLKLPSSISIIGNGNAGQYTSGGTVLNCVGAGDCLSTEDSTDIDLELIQLKGNRVSGSVGIRLGSTTAAYGYNISLRRVTVNGFQDGMVIQNAFNVFCYDCDIYSNSRYGIYHHPPTNTTHLAFYSLHLHNNGAMGWFSDGPAGNVAFYSGVIEGNAPVEMVLNKMSGTHLFNCYFESAGASTAIDATGSTETRVVGMYSQGYQSHIISTGQLFGLTVEGLRTVNTAGPYAISLTGNAQQQGAIRIRDSRLDADVNLNSADYVLDGNLLKPSTGSGGGDAYVMDSPLNDFSEYRSGMSYGNVMGSSFLVSSGLRGIGIHQNLLRSSQTLGNAPWTAAKVVTGASADPAPDGSRTATSLKFSLGDANSGLYQTVAVAGSTYYTFSLWVKVSGGKASNNGTYVQVRDNSDDSGGVYTVTQKFIGSTLTNQWQRFVVSLKTGQRATALTVGLFSSDAVQLDAWGAQLVTGSSPAVYVATTTSPISDNTAMGQLDVLTAGGATLSPSGLTLPSSKFSGLGTATNGTIIYCNDCIVGASCASGGTGAFAKRLNGKWICN